MNNQETWDTTLELFGGCEVHTSPNKQLDINSPEQLLNQAQIIQPSDDKYIKHPLLKNMDNPHIPLYFDLSHVTINGIDYQEPLFLPLHNAHGELKQVAVMQLDKVTSIICESKPLAFALLGDYNKDKPLIIEYDLVNAFRLLACGYPVALAVFKERLSDCPRTALADWQCNVIASVVNQLKRAGYQQLYVISYPQAHPKIHAPLDKALAAHPVQFINMELLPYVMDFSEVKEIINTVIATNNVVTHTTLAQGANQWGELLPLHQAETKACNPYPIEALPLLARDAILAIAEHVQSPISMAAQCVIGAMSHIAQAKVNAPDRFKACGEPCGLFLLTEGQSGSRKSTSRNLADRAILDHEREQYEIYRAELEQWKSGQAGLSKKDREAYCAENPPPNDPSTLYSDITLESIAGLYIDGILQNASISSDEAGQFFGGHTMKSDTRTQALGGYAKLFDDGYIERTRSKSNLNGSGRAHDVRLTFNLQGQHEVLADALKDPVLRGQGFLPRFILTIPENLAGTRLQDAAYRAKNANHDHRLIAYWTRCSHLLDSCPQVQVEHESHNGRYVIPMDEAATAIDAEFYNLFESLQGKGKRYEYLQAFASRASQLARRLATVFAYFEGLQAIDARTLEGAYTVVKHSLNEWAMYADIEVQKESDAEKLIKWFVRYCANKKTTCVSKAIALRGAPSHLRKVKEFDLCLNELIEFNYVRLVVIDKSTYIELNPLLLK